MSIAEKHTSLTPPLRPASRVGRRGDELSGRAGRVSLVVVSEEVVRAGRPRPLIHTRFQAPSGKTPVPVHGPALEDDSPPPAISRRLQLSIAS